MKGKKFVGKPTNGSVSVGTQVGLTRDRLLSLKARAVRQGSWFRSLSRAERAYIELTIKVVERVRSRLVAKVLAGIIRKLLNAMRSRVACLIKELGHTLARKLSQTAQNWGNLSASRWAKDSGFIQYLAVIYMNSVGFFGS